MHFNFQGANWQMSTSSQGLVFQGHGVLSHLLIQAKGVQVRQVFGMFIEGGKLFT